MNDTFKRNRRLGTTLLVLLAAACASAATPGVDPVGPEPRGFDPRGDDRSTAPPAGCVFGISKPSQELKLAFAQAGVVSTVLVKQGDVVKVGQILAEQDDSSDKIAADALKVDAESTAEVEYSIADEKEKKTLLKRKQDMYAQKVATLTEVEAAEQDVQLATARITIAQNEHKKKQYDYAKQMDKLEHMKLKSPINGVVRKLNIGPGEMADPQSREGVVNVTQWDPVWIEANPSTIEAKDFKLDQMLGVQFEGDEQWQKAKVVFLDQYDFGSETRLIRLELENKELRPPGLKVTVKLPEKSSERPVRH